MKRYTRGEEREGFRVLLVWPGARGGVWEEARLEAGLGAKPKRVIYEECETNERCLTEALRMMDEEAYLRVAGAEVHIQEFYDDDWNTAVAFGWDAKKRVWGRMKVLMTGSTESARVRVALVLPGERDVMVQDCGEEQGDCYRALAELRSNIGARVPGAQLHVQVKHPAGAWASHRYEEYRRGKWVMVPLPSELVYLRNRRAR